VSRCFLFKPDGIGDFFLASGVVRLMAREFGEENLIIAVLPIMESVVKGQFPRSKVVSLPIRKKRVILNVFAANLLRCFFSWLSLLGKRVDVSISLRHMRDYLQSFLFCTVRSPRRILASNLLLGNGRPVRRWTESALERLFSLEITRYPKGSDGVPSELEANRLLASVALRRDVNLLEIWPELKPVGGPPIEGSYSVCAPFSSDVWKNFPEQRWCELFHELKRRGQLVHLVLTGSSDQLPRLSDFSRLLRESSGEPLSTSIEIASDLQGFIDLLAGANVVFTVDTAAAHAATALDCRTLVLFSGLHQGMFGPWNSSPRQQWVLPEELKKGGAWHEAHSTGKILSIVDKIQSAP